MLYSSILLLFLLACADRAFGSSAAASKPPFPTTPKSSSSNSFGSDTFVIDLVRNEKYKRNGAVEYARALRKYGASLDAKFGKKVSSDLPGRKGFANSTGSINAVNQTYDREYLSEVYVGTPGQLCWLDLDTGSADLWLFSSDTPSFYLNGQKIYRPEKSQTAAKVINASWAIAYGDGSFAGGSVYRDTVRLGDVKLYNATVESATAVSRSLVSDATMSGILGLALNHSSTVFPAQATVLDSLTPVLKAPLFAVDLKYSDTGTYHFGYINESAYTGVLEWRDVVPQSRFWEFNLQAIHFGGDNVWRVHDWPMVADTGTTLMLLPQDLVELYWARVPGAFLSAEFYGWVYPCETELPDFDFGFVDGWTASVPGRYFDFVKVNEALCYGGIQDSMQTFGILGDVFLKTLYVVFDIANARVGLAQKKLLA